MSIQELYIRNPSETEARGPFTSEHLLTLAENGTLTKETLYYDNDTEQWRAIGENADICAIVFPEKSPLKLKTKNTLKTLNTPEPTAAPISVDDMLAAAEGRTSDTRNKIDPILARERAAAIGLWSTIVILIISAAAFCLPHIDILVEAAPMKIIMEPTAVLGLFQALLAVLLLLQVTQVYPLVRFSAMLSIGLVGFLLWTRDLTTPLTSLTVGALGLYFCTVFINFVGIGIAAGLGFFGLTGYAIFAITT